MSTNENPLKIFGVPISVHTRKVLMAAQYKSIPREVVPVIPLIPGNPPANWRSISPTGMVPAIDDEGYVLADSTAIVIYLEGKVPEPGLLPSEPRDHGRALFLDSWAGTALFRTLVRPLFHEQVAQPQIYKRLGDAALIETALRHRAPEAFEYLESLAPEQYLVAGKLSIADLAVVSNLVMFHYLGHRIDARFPKLNTYFRAHLDTPLVAETLQRERPIVEQMNLDLSLFS